MTKDIPRDFLICYDIADERRIGRLHRALVREATPVQYSVFLVQADRKHMKRLISMIIECIDECEDDVRIYPLSRGNGLFQFGRPRFPGGVLLFDAKGCHVWG